MTPNDVDFSCQWQPTTIQNMARVQRQDYPRQIQSWRRLPRLWKDYMFRCLVTKEQQDIFTSQ